MRYGRCTSKTALEVHLAGSQVVVRKSNTYRNVCLWSFPATSAATKNRPGPHLSTSVPRTPTTTRAPHDRHGSRPTCHPANAAASRLCTSPPTWRRWPTRRRPSMTCPSGRKPHSYWTPSSCACHSRRRRPSSVRACESTPASGRRDDPHRDRIQPPAHAVRPLRR